MSYITLNKSNYFHNLSFINNFVKKENIILVLKDNAYGHGLEQISSLAQEWGIKKVAVKNTDEALQIKDKFEKIIILSQNMREKLTQNHNFIYNINYIEHIKHFEKGTKVALKIDTGMHRNGIDIDQVELALKMICDNGLILTDVLSHFHTPSSSSFDTQKKLFLDCKEQIKNLDFKPRYHIHASGGFLSESNCFLNKDFFEKNEDFDLRIGLLQYGYAPHLKEVLSLYAQKISTRVLKKGESVGYNAMFIAKEDIKISCYDIGYGDGFFRYNGKNDFMLANKEKIIGCMSMDSFSTIDCGDEVCVFDNASYVAEFFNTIEYEILVKLNKHIKRYII